VIVTGWTPRDRREPALVHPPRSPIGSKRLRSNTRLTLVLGVWFAVLLPARAQAEPTVYRFGAGSKSGGFTQISNALAEGLRATEAPFELDIQHTDGSCANIRRLLRGEIEFALVQYDVAAEAFQAGRTVAAPEAEATDGESRQGGFMCRISSAMAKGVQLRMIAAVTDGAVHVLVRRPVQLDSFDRLTDHRIYIGTRGSGSFETARVIVGAAGLTVDKLDRLDADGGDAFEAMRRDEILMMLRTTEPGDRQISAAVADGIATVNPLPDDVLERLIDAYPYYRVCEIKANTYPGMEYVVPTVCVSTVVLTVLPPPTDEARRLEMDAAVGRILTAIDWVEAAPAHEGLQVHHRFRGFAEREPIPVHSVAETVERLEFRHRLLWAFGSLLMVTAIIVVVRRLLQRRGLLKDPLESGIEGQLSNPLIPFAGFVAVVLSATFMVWSLEHDSNARVRTLTDSFWEMNMFATGNFSTDSLKTSSARFIGATATIGGLGLLAWFTAALTSIFAREEMRVPWRLRNHIVILNFREEMLQLIRMLRSPGPLRSRAIHVVVSDALPKRVRLHLARVKGVTIYRRNPEIPEDLASLRIPRAARVIVLNRDAEAKSLYHPLRVARAVHQACSRVASAGIATRPKLGKTGFSVAPAQHPALASEDGSDGASLPITLVEATADEPSEIFEPFREWIVPVQGRVLADRWLATACVDPGFAEIFNGLASFREDNAEVYTASLPPWFHGKPWRSVRRTLCALEVRAGVVPLGIYRAVGIHAYESGATARSSPQHELQKRLIVNPPLDLRIGPEDRLLAFAENEADLLAVLRLSRRAASEPEPPHAD